MSIYLFINYIFLLVAALCTNLRSKFERCFFYFYFYFYKKSVCELGAFVMEFRATEISYEFQILCVLQLQLTLLHC